MRRPEGQTLYGRQIRSAWDLVYGGPGIGIVLAHGLFFVNGVIITLVMLVRPPHWIAIFPLVLLFFGARWVSGVLSRADQVLKRGPLSVTGPTDQFTTQESSGYSGSYTSYGVRIGTKSFRIKKQVYQSLRNGELVTAYFYGTDSSVLESIRIATRNPLLTRKE